jgi:hypothetical protein
MSLIFAIETFFGSRMIDQFSPSDLKDTRFLDKHPMLSKKLGISVKRRVSRPRNFQLISSVFRALGVSGESPVEKRKLSSSLETLRDQQ